MALLFRLRWQIVKKYNQSYWASLTLIRCANEVKVQHFNQITTSLKKRVSSLKVLVY